jgi:signal transduction histidine kinase/CheY-like chemotaxis protein
MCFAVGNLSVTLLMLVLGEWVAALLTLGLSLLYVSPRWLIPAGYKSLGKGLPILAGGLGVFGFCLVGGNATGAHLCLFMLVCWPFVMFDVRRHALKIGSVVFAAAVIFVCTEMGLWPHVGNLQMEAATLAFLRPTLATFAFAFFGAVTFYVTRQSQNQEDVLVEQTVQLTKAREAAEQALNTRSQFLALMSHELRTPMNGILGAVQGLQDSKLTEEQGSQMAIVRYSAEHLHCLLRDILESASAQSPELQLFNEPSDLRVVLAQAVRPFREQAVLRGLAFEELLDLPNERVIVDAGRLCQVVSNLLSNAVKFTATGGIKFAATSKSEGNNWLVDVSVTDTGPGISEELKTTIFEEFRQGERFERRHHDGIGLGLSSARRIVTALQGKLELQSEVGSGSKFTVRVSLLRAPEPALRSDAAPKSNPAAGPSSVAADSGTRGRSLRILVAEDNIVNQQVICRLLGKLGVTPTVVSDGQQALEAVKREAWDLILMDIQMPVMDGLEATRAIRELPDERRKLPIVAVTANANPDQVQAGMSAGLDKYLTKPVRLVELKAVFDTFVGLGDSGSRPLKSSA